MRVHGHFTLFGRTIPGGKKVVYYYAYDKNDVRVGPWSTGERTLTAARNKCEDLYRTGNLIPSRERPLTFGQYAAGFWEAGSDYLNNQMGRADITPSYVDNCRKMTANQIIPFFGGWSLEKITGRDINRWLLGFAKRGAKGYKNTYANTVFGTLNVMLAFAVEQEIIKTNPCAKIRRLKNDRKKIEIITMEEVQKLFSKDWKKIWDGKGTAYIANRLACLTGMRAGEIAGLRGEYLFDDYIYICGSYGEYGYGPTKTKETRFIPLIPEMISLLKRLKERNGNGEGYLFSLDGGITPASRKHIYDEFHRALVRIGIEPDEIARRGLSLHSWRHFLNTELQRQGLSLQQVQAVMGHKSDRMTEWYSHFDARKLSDVMEAQQVITGGKKPGKTKRAEFKIVKMPECEEAARKRA